MIEAIAIGFLLGLPVGVWIGARRRVHTEHHHHDWKGMGG